MSQELRSLGKITLPIAITGALQFSKSIISLYYMSCLGVVPLAACSFSNSFTNISGHSIMKGLAMAMEPICCQAYGANRWATLTQTHNRTVILLSLVAIPIIALWLSMKPILFWLGKDQELTGAIMEYIRYSIFELLAQAYLHVLKNFIRSQGITRPIYISATVATILHLLITYLLVQILNLGVKGLALASGLCSLNMIIGLLFYLFISNSTLKPWDKPASTTRSEGWKPLLRSTLPSILSVCLEWWWYEIMLLICIRVNDPKVTMSAMGILMQMTGLLYVIPHSLSLSMSTCVGKELGASQPVIAQKISVIGITSASVLGLVASAFAFSMKNVLGKLFTIEPRIFSLTSAVLPLLGLCEIGNYPQTTATGILRGSARQKVVAYIHFSSFYLIGLPVAILETFVYKKGVMGPWIGHAAAQISCVIMMLYTLARTDWKDQARRASELTQDTECILNDTEAHLLE